MQQDKGHSEKILRKYQTGTLTDAEKKSVAQWLSKLDSQEGEVPSTEVKALEQRSIQEIRQHYFPKPVKPLFSLYSKIAAIAACVLTMLGLGLWYYQHSQHSQSVMAAAEDMQVVATGIGEQKTISLSDGSQVILNSKSQLAYPKKFHVDSREVKLTGEAFFEVSKNPEKPFRVQMQDFDVQVLGTSFNIKSYPADATYSVSVKTGRVAVSNKDQEEIILNRGEGVRIMAESGSWERQEINPESISAWKTGKLVFMDESLADIAKVLERRYHIRITFKDAAIAQQKLNITIKDQALSQVLDVLQLSGNFGYTKQADRILIWGK